MKILVTNDDGVSTPILPHLARWAMTLGDVTVIAPKFEQSGKSHGIDIIHPFEVKKVKIAEDIEAYSLDSTPADCVRFGVLALKEKYDLVISGINLGYNIGRDIVYSGTVGAIYEAASFGIQAMAISTSRENPDRAPLHLDRVYQYIADNDLFTYSQLYNVNIPPEAKEIHITHQGGPYYSDDFIAMPNDMYRQVGKFVYTYGEDLTLDTDAVMNGYISITPLTNERTNIDAFHKLVQK